MKIHPETLFYFIALGAYIFSAVLYLGGIWISRLAAVAGMSAFFGLSAHTLSLAARGMASGRIPLVNLYEFVLLFAWGTVLIHLLMQRRFKAQGLGLPVLLLVIMLMVYAGNLSKEIHPLMPALQSYWLKVHVAVAILAYGSFAVSFGAALLYLIKDRLAILPDIDPEQLVYKAIAFGFPFMTLVLVTGAVWAEQVWGTWWSWDPKETWALVTWLIYAIYLHSRFNRGWRGQRSAWMAVAGFGAVVFTLFGVTWLLPGLHSYI